MLQLVPLKKAMTRECPLEVLLKIDVDQLSLPQAGRIPLNLSLVLDRSGSMQGRNLEWTKEAAIRALTMLEPADHLSLVIFDDKIDLLYSGPFENREAVETLIRGVQARNNTDLCGGWLLGAQELSKVTRPDRLSRVILLTDGEANAGVTEPAQICAKVGGWSSRAVQTTTLGFGAGYNQDLLKQMADEGGGNHGYIQDADHLSAFFDEEMSSLVKTRGTQVRVQLTPATGGYLEWLVPPNLDADGKVRLGNLVQGQPLALVFRWRADMAGNDCGLSVTVSWNDLSSGGARSEQCHISLPLVDRPKWLELPEEPEVQAQTARAQAELRRRGARQLLQQEQFDLAYQWLGWALELPHLPEEERAALLDLQDTVARRDIQGGLKKAAMYSHGHGHGHARVSSHYSQPQSAHSPKPRLSLPLGDGPVLHRTWKWPAAPWRRLEGMLRGHFFGERLVRGDKAILGEGASLTITTLRHQLQHLFKIDRLAQELASTPLLHPTTSQQRFRRAYEKDDPVLLEVGSDSAGCAALRRVCPFLVVYRDNPLLDAVLATVITHRDNLALCACLGYLNLLGALLRVAILPAKEFYLDTFCSALQGLEQRKYSCETGQFKGWSGYPSEFLRMAIHSAREQSLDLAQAMRSWGSGPYLLEVLPSLLYALELHAHEPWPALLNVSQNALEPDTLAMLTGAALGALHGNQLGWFLAPEVDQLLDEVKSQNY
ncbi:MAG: VWA domain-containing protein [Vulcanimicrobiota bacterium]